VQTFTDTFRHRFVLSNLVAKNFKTLYRNMALGLLWAVLNPLVMITVLSVVWMLFVADFPSFPSFAMVAYVPFLFFQYCLSGCTHSIVGNANLVKKVAFPRQILPFAVILTHLIHLGIQIPLVVAVLLLFPPDANVLGVQLLWLPVIFAVQLGLVVGCGLLVASLNVVYRDVQYVVDSLMVVLFWASPVIYKAFDAQALTDRTWLFVLYYLNPLAGIFEAYRNVLFYGAAPHPDTFLLAVAVTAILGVWGMRSFWIHEKEFADLI
jgi:ABC-2 type transport system permease protein